MPEAFLQVGVNLFRNLRLAVGYNFLYISSVVRAGDQIDRTINETQAGPNDDRVASTLTGEARPKPLHHTTYYWAQGINIGVEFRY